MKTEKQIARYIEHLRTEERSESTMKQYKRELGSFMDFAGRGRITKSAVIGYKEEIRKKCRPSSVNTKLAAVNGFLMFIGKRDLMVRPLRIQKSAFCSGNREITKTEYMKLVETAKKRHDYRLALVMQTICGTGIRVSELSAITVEAVRSGEAVIRLKGKTRVILIPGRLCKLLNSYIQKNGIVSGAVFVTRNGRPLDRSNIWRMMKKLCIAAGIDPDKVFPHNLRHLFARCFYDTDHDIARLADVLGHSSINTTRIYIVTSGTDHREKMNSLGLIM